MLFNTVNMDKLLQGNTALFITLWKSDTELTMHYYQPILSGFILLGLKVKCSDLTWSLNSKHQKSITF